MCQVFVWQRWYFFAPMLKGFLAKALAAAMASHLGEAPEKKNGMVNVKRH
jgi:hypothetical protein